MNASRYRRLLLVMLTTLLTLTPFTSAFATKPEVQTFPIDVTSVIGECDGFSVIEHLEGEITVSTHFDQAGNFMMEISRFSLRHTFSNSETGASLFSPDVGIDRITLNEEGEAILAGIGIIRRIVVPGEGLVFAQVGIIRINLATGEVLFVGGPHEDFAGFLPALCSALA